MSDSKVTDFGFQQVPVGEKSSKVAEVFDSVASRYDLMNDLMSGGIHRLWKKMTIASANVKQGQKVLDIAGGTGDLALAFARNVGTQGQVILADINASMLSVGRDRLIDQGIADDIQYVQADAQYLPFADNHFDCITIAFGLRNVTDKQLALASMFRVLKPGGRLLILEFSKPVIPLLAKIYDSYSFNLLPWMGKIVADDEDSYRYLAESIRMHPNQDKLLSMMKDSGYQYCDVSNMTGGIVALHRGFKPDMTSGSSL